MEYILQPAYWILRTLLKDDMTSRILHMKSFVSALVVFALVHFTAAISWAQSSIISPTGPVTLTYAPGQPAVLKIDDHHEATVYVSHSEPLGLDINLNVAENLCDPNYRKPTCVYSAAFSSDRIILLWSKHSDPAKIGQKIKYQYKSDSTENHFNELSERINASSLDPYVNKKPDARYTPEKLTCDQYEWLGGQFANTANSDKKLPDLRFKILSSEMMRMNDETGINENRTTMMAENVLLRPNGQTYQLTSVGRLITAGNYSNSFNFFFAGQTTTLQIMGPNPKQLCQVSLSCNILQVLKGRDTEKNYNEKPNFKIFYDYTLPKFLSFKKTLQPLLKLSEGTVLEFQ